jgi:hypothetical protein
VASLVTVYSTVSVLHTRLRRRVASSFAVGFSSRSGRSRGRGPEGDARVFRPCSRDSDPSCGTESAIAAFRRPRTPCAHRLGERTKRHNLGRVLSSRGLARQPPGLSCSRASRPETHCLRTGLAPANVSLHAPSTDSTLGSIMGPTGSPVTTTEGNARASRPLHTLCTLAAPRTADDPVRVTHLLRRWTPFPRRASRPSLGHVAKMPRIPFLQPTFHVTSTRRNITFGDHPPSAVGKPASVRLLGSSPGPSGLPLLPEDDAGPPCGHPASNGLALDGALPASGRSTLTFTRCGMG